MLLFQQSVVSPDQLLEINPYNAAGYGLAILVLSVGLYVFYGRWREEQEYSRQLSHDMMEYNKEVLKIMSKVEVRLNDQQSMTGAMGDIKNAINQVLNHIESVSRKIESRN